MLNLVTCVTGDYPHTERWLESARCVKSAKVWCICYGWPHFPGHYDNWTKKYPHVEFRFMPRHWSESFGMLQHGRALDAIPELGPGDVVVQSDADCIIQRDFNHLELESIPRLRSITMTVNDGPGDNAKKEAERIGLKNYRDWSTALFPIRNCGVMVAPVYVFIALRDKYEQWCARFYSQCRHRCRCQWLINWTAFLLDISNMLNNSLHQHGHFGIPEGVTFKDGLAYYNGELIMFRHKLEEQK